MATAILRFSSSQLPKRRILVYRLAEGSLQYTISFAESGYPIMFSFQPSAKSLDVLLLNTDRSEPVPLVKRYDLNGNLTAQFIPSDDLEIFAALAYDTAGHLVMGSSRCLLATDFISEQPVWRANFARVASFVGTSAGVAVLASDRADGPYNLYIIDSDGVCTLIGAAGDSVTPLAAKGSTVSWGSGSRLFLADVSKQKLLEPRMMDADVLRINASAQGLFTVITRRSTGTVY